MPRCHIQPAYTRSPAERAGGWLQENFFRVLSALVVAVAFWFLFAVAVDHILNIFATGDVDSRTKMFYSDSPVLLPFRVGGCLLFAYFMLFRVRINSDH